MGISAKKIELLDWLLHTSDIKLLMKVEKLKEEFSNKPNNQPVFGRLKGKIKMADDFNAPLDDFNGYMH